jgi:glycosyltransferase involved in cell wall biosynthesis
MKIGITTAFFRNYRAGTWVYARNLLQALDALAAGDRQLFTIDYQDATFAGLANIPHLKYGGAANRPAKIIWPNLVLPCRAGRDGFDLIHATTHYGTLVPCRYKNVITVTDVSPLLHPETHGRLQVAYHRRLFPLVLKRADAVVTISASSKKDIVSACGIAEDKVHVIHLGVEPRFVPDAPEESEFARQLPERYILNIGTLEARKNLPRLLEAYAIARKRGLDRKLLIGGATGWRLSNLAAIVDKFGLEEDVNFLGYVKDEELPILYGRADFFVYPSLYEGFGLPILEAMACGTPVITSDCSSMPEVAGEAALLVDPLDVEALAEKMLELVSDKELAASLRARGIERAGRFTWEKTARQTVALYKRTICGY